MSISSPCYQFKINTSVKTGTNVSIFPPLSINRCLEFFPNNYSADNKTNLTVVSFQWYMLKMDQKSNRTTMTASRNHVLLPERMRRIFANALERNWHQDAHPTLCIFTGGAGSGNGGEYLLRIIKYWIQKSVKQPSVEIYCLI